jgi:hypothetical protein
VALLATLLVLPPTPAAAEDLVTVRVMIERVEQRGCTDSLSGSDFYSRIVIDGRSTDFGRIDGEDEIDPFWAAEQVVDADATSSVAIVVKISEFDDFLNFEDDECDLTAGPGTDLNLGLDPDPCTVSGDISGPCSTQLETTGGGGRSVFVRFRVDIIEPEVRCTHAPLWPQPGDDVTITVESMDAALQVGDTLVDRSSAPDPPPPLVARTRVADDLEIWVDDQSGPAFSDTDRTTASFVVTDVAAGDLTYACKITAGGESKETGWRRTRVGPPESGSAIPVMFTGDRPERVDVVFIADSDDYLGPGDPAFQSDVGNVIRGGYFGQDYFLAAQREFNFWLADQTGDANRVPAPRPTDPNNTRCVLTKPANWPDQYSWVDTGAIIHADTFRDCASGGVFSSEPTSLGTVLHETGHSPFGLADEYCCDGGYFENRPNPNMFDTLAECQADAPELGRVGSDCRSITDTRPTPNAVWFLSEPTPNDLMNRDRRPPQAADTRRMGWFLENCAMSRC